MYVCMYVCVCMYVRTYLPTYVHMYLRVRRYVCIHTQIRIGMKGSGAGGRLRFLFLPQDPFAAASPARQLQIVQATAGSWQSSGDQIGSLKRNGSSVRSLHTKCEQSCFRLPCFGRAEQTFRLGQADLGFRTVIRSVGVAVR